MDKKEFNPSAFFEGTKNLKSTRKIKGALAFLVKKKKDQQTMNVLGMTEKIIAAELYLKERLRISQL